MTRLLLTTAVLVGACTAETTTPIPDDPVGDTIDEGVARGNFIADLSSSELSGEPDEFVVIGKTASILAVLNDGEIDQASFAIQVVLEGDIFDFANALIVDHEDANIDLDAAVRYYGAGYFASSTADTLADEMAAGMNELRSTPPEDIDFAFVELQVINHAEAQVLLDELALQVGPGVMGDHILDTQAMVDLHFQEATDLLDTFY